MVFLQGSPVAGEVGEALEAKTGQGEVLPVDDLGNDAHVFPDACPGVGCS